MTTILRASGAADLLAHIPLLTGFTPRRSVVLLPFVDARTTGALRFDAPEGPALDDAEETARFAATAVGTACRVADANALAIAFYVDEPLRTDESSLPFADLAAELMHRADACGLQLVEALCVGPDGWADYRDAIGVVRDLAEVPAPPTVPGFGGIGEDQRSGAALPEIDAAELDLVSRALVATEQALDGMTRRERVDPQAIAAALAVDDLPLFLESVLERPENLPSYATATLIHVLSRPLFRDVALVQWARDLPTGDRALVAQLAFAGDVSTIPSDLGETLFGAGPRPDADRLRLALSTVRAAAARAPRSHRPGPLVAAAWLSWALGQSTHAACYLEDAMEIDPGHSFGRMLRAVVDASHLPEWAFHRSRTA